MIGFVNHLRLNDYTLGLPEAEAAVALLMQQPLSNVGETKLRLRSLLAKRKEEWERFDADFEAYWYARGRRRDRSRRTGNTPRRPTRPGVWNDHLERQNGHGDSPGDPRSCGGGGGETRAGEGRLIASKQTPLHARDLRHLADRAEMEEAERAAEALARALRYRLSRRYRLQSARQRLDLRRTLRRSLAKGGTPIDPVWRARPEEQVRIVVLLDISGSMELYSRFFLQFVKGLVAQWAESDAYLFHTRLLRVTEGLRERDPIKAMTRLSLMAGGFGGGTEIGASLKTFNDRYAKQALNGRSVAIILSDGYDTGVPADLVRELARLRRRARRLIWLNPLLGWRDYRAINRAMTAALPLLDHFASAHNLESLAALEPQLARL
ncbi:MAG: VWA domain-containing protein [Rhodospirillales bacterium]|nr:VWA domain-containing protein [Rhodospirillales bacterium]